LDFNGLADIAVGAAVIVFVLAHKYVGGFLDGGLFIIPDAVDPRRQRLQELLFNIEELAPPAPLAVAQQVVVELHKLVGNGTVELTKTEKRVFAQRVEYTLVDKGHRPLHKCLVLRAVWTCRVKGTAVMLPEVRKGLVENGGVPGAFADSGLQVVGDYRIRYAADKAKAIDKAADKILTFLAGYGPDIGVLATRQDTYKYFGLDLFPRLSVKIKKLFAAKVHEKLFPGPVGQLPADVVAFAPLPVVPGKLAVFIPFRMLCHIFLPELLQGTPRLFHLFLDICKLPGKLFIPVFFRLAVLGKKLFQVLSLKGQELCVPQPKLLEPPDIPVHCFPVDSH